MAKRLARPRTILRLILLGFALATLPLIFALIHASLSVDRLTNQSQSAVRQAVNITKASRTLVDSLVSVERSARQYQVLGEDALLKVYRDNRDLFEKNVAELAQLPLEAPLAALLSSLHADEREIYRTLVEYPRDSLEAQEALDRFGALADIARGILAQNNRLIDLKVQSMEQSGDRLQIELTWETLALIPAALLLAVIFTVLITRPIRQLNRAIERLGAGEFDRAVEVSGPRDLEVLGERLEWLRQRLLELEESKRKFIRHISHELKTPLTTLREGTELLQENLLGPLNPRQAEVVQILQRSALNLQKLIEDLLSFSVATKDGAQFQTHSVRLDRLVKSVVANHRITLESRQLRLRHSLEPIPIHGDEAKLKTVVDNLLSNALKYCPERGVLKLRVYRDSECAVLEVADSGPGIPPEERERVFEAFFQGSTPRLGPVKGTGLGLSIAREYVEAHGGEIAVVDDASLSGACLRVTLPTRVVSEPQSEKAA